MWFNKEKEQPEQTPETAAPRSRSRATSDMRSELGLANDDNAPRRSRSSNEASDKKYNEEIMLNDLKVRARRRMIGAFVLLAAAFVVLPWVFDDNRKQTAPVVSVVVPEKQIQFEVQNPKAVDASVASSVDNLKPEDKKAADKKPETAKAEEVAPPVADVKKKFVVHIGIVSNKAELDALKSRLQAKGVKINTDVVKGADGGTKTRVRLGPFDSKNSAQLAADQVKGAAKNPIVIEVK